MERMKGHYTAIRVKCEHIDDEGKRVIFRPVIGDSEENAKFFAATPGGVIDLQVVSVAARAGLDVGREYDVHFYAREAPANLTDEMSRPRFFPSRIGRQE